MTTSSDASAATDKVEQTVQKAVDLLMRGETLGELMGHSADTQEALYALGYSFYNTGKYAEAEKIFAALLLCNHTDRRLYLSYAACLQMQRRHEDALRYYGVAALLDLTDSTTVFHCAQCLLAIGKREEAVHSLQHVLEMPARSDEARAIADRAKGLLDVLMSSMNASADPATAPSAAVLSGAHAVPNTPLT